MHSNHCAFVCKRMSPISEYLNHREVLGPCIKGHQVYFTFQSSPYRSVYNISTKLNCKNVC